MLEPSDAEDEVTIEVVSRRELDRYLGSFQGSVGSFVGGMGFVRLGLREHASPFDFVHPEEPDLPLLARSELVPFAAVRKVVLARAGGELRIFERLVRRVDGTVYHFETPPPAASEWAETHEVKGFDPSSERGALRYKIWRVHRDIVREHTSEVGGEIVPVPEGAVNEEGPL